jgi:hypothetical protein
MKKLFLIITLCTLSIGSFAHDFSVSEKRDFEKLSVLENEFSNGNMNTQQVLNQAANQGINLEQENATVSINRGSGEMPLVSGFWWGCCLGVVGLLVVYLVTDHDKDQVRKALIGCVISTLIVGIGGLLDVFSWF